MRLTNLAADLRRGARTLWRTPGFTALAIATLALGIGTVTALFTVLEQVVLRPLPVHDQDRLVVAWNRHTTRDIAHFPFLYGGFQAVQDAVPALEGVAATSATGSTEVLARVGDGEQEVLRQSAVLGDFFGLLGVGPVLGRTLRLDDDAPGAAAAVVISHDLWGRRWNGSPDALGATLELADEPYRVVGVAPRGFQYPQGTDVWVSYRRSYVDRGLGELYIEADLVARLRPGATADQARAQIAELYRARPDLRADQGLEPVVRPFTEVVLGDLRAALLLLFGGGALVLALACVNVGNLVTVRAAGRDGAMAVRRALGATRTRLAGEALSEALWLGVAGGAGGWLVARAALGGLRPQVPAGLPRMDLLTLPDGRALLMTSAVSAAVVVVLALLPVVRAGRLDPARALQRGGRVGTERRARRGRDGVVVAQAALAVWCAALALLLARSLVNLERLDPGFEPDDLVLVDLVVPYGFGQAPEDYPDRLDGIGQRLEAHPGVTAVTPVLSAPLIGDRGWTFLPRLEGQTPDDARRSNAMLTWEIVQPNHFETLELPLMRGRALEPGDRTGTEQVIVVNERAARTLWPGQEPLGQRLAAFGPQAESEWWTVVGVTADSRYHALLEPRPVVYFPLRQLSFVPLSHLLVRVGAESPDLLPLVREAVAAEDPALRVTGASAIGAHLAAPLARPRFATLVLALLAATTLLLAAVGVYGVMSAAVRARTREMGVRMAVGAAPGDVRKLLLGRGLGLTLAGAAVGALAVLPGNRLLESLLFGVAPTDPWSHAFAGALVLAVALLACWLPARRAARLDPAGVLRG